MTKNEVLEMVAAWPVNEQVDLVQDVWDHVAESTWLPRPSPELIGELRRRLATARANPKEVADPQRIAELLEDKS